MTNNFHVFPINYLHNIRYISFFPAEKTVDTITKLVMVLLVIMGLVLVWMETVMDPVVTGNWSPSIDGLLKPKTQQKTIFNG